MPAILRLPAVINKTGLSRSAIYALMAKQEFPSAINLGFRTVGWVEDEIDQWIEKKISESRPEPTL